MAILVFVCVKRILDSTRDGRYLIGTHPLVNVYPLLAAYISLFAATRNQTQTTRR